MSNRYVDVSIIRESKPVNVVGFGTALVLGTSKSQGYKEYINIEAVEKDYDTNSKEYELAKRMFNGGVDEYNRKKSPSKVAILSIAWDESSGAVTALTEALNTNKSNWYYLVTTTKDAEAIEALAEWTEENKKFFGTTITDLELLESLQGFERTYVQVSDNPESLAGEAVIALASVTNPGNITFTFKQLQNVSPTNFSNAEIDEIHALNGNTYIKEGGYDMTSGSKVMSGTYMDEILGQDYIEAELFKNTMEIIAKNGKIPFDDIGIALAVGAVDKTLKTAANNGVIAKDSAGNGMYEITVPRIEDISKSDKANRQLKGIVWKATQEGAVEHIEISGVLMI